MVRSKFSLKTLRKDLAKVIGKSSSFGESLKERLKRGYQKNKRVIHIGLGVAGAVGTAAIAHHYLKKNKKAAQELKKAEHKVEEAEHKVKKAEHEVKKAENEVKKAEHEVDEAKRQEEQAEHDVKKAEHEVEEAKRQEEEIQAKQVKERLNNKKELLQLINNNGYSRDTRTLDYLYDNKSQDGDWDWVYRVKDLIKSLGLPITEQSTIGELKKAI